MTSPHEKLPWHCLTEHVDFDGSIGFKVRPDSHIDGRKQASTHFTRALASLIVEAAEEQLSRLPKPNASRDAWKEVGVEDNALFPVECLDAMNVPVYSHPNNTTFRQLKHWERAVSERDAQIMSNFVMKPANPFQYLASFIYLAQHARVQADFFTGYGGGSGSNSFVLSTLSYYLFLNIILALDAGASFNKGTIRASLFHTHSQNSLPLPSYDSNENPHTVFWYSTARAYRNPGLRAAYNLHSFRLLVASYAILKEATLRDVALGIDPYKKSYAEPTAFDKGILVDVICRALKSISPAFADLEPSVARDPPLTLPNPPPTSSIEHQPQRQSRFVGLPNEIHRYIYSFLPESLKSLVNLAATCSRLREICTPLIYVEPFPAHTRETPGLGARTAALVKVLSYAPHLSSHIRRLSVCVEGNSCHSRYCEYVYPPLHLCLADSLMDLVELHLYAACPCEDRKSEGEGHLKVGCEFRTLDAITAITRRWPNLLSLGLFMPATLDFHDYGPPTTRDIPATSMSIPQNLQTLTIFPNLYGVPLIPRASQKALINASSQTLRHLVLHLEPTTPMHDLPVFPSLERLVLIPNMPIERLCFLLRKSFSSVRFLSLNMERDSADSPGVTLDLSDIFDDLEHLRVFATSVSHYILPPSVVIVEMRSMSRVPPSISVTGSPHLAALCISGRYDTFAERYAALEALTSHPDAFQIMRSLEVRFMIKVPQLPQVGELIATRLPKLEVLILFVKKFHYRPRREDYPMDDGLDDVQKAAAVDLFKRCPGLKTISFGCIPEVCDPIGRFPVRVWTRDSQEGGARMTGRAALPWKVCEHSSRSFQLDWFY